ncbi:hypothetical protein PF003_g420 [Phytophthora fragariae]|nr:hypothetical protein PF003_g420 [Phytophthora fragariae]
MVRLSSRSYLHLTPEVVDGDFDQPFYAKVMRLDAEWVSFRSLQGGEGRVPRNVAEAHTVTANEVNKAGRESLLRCAVSAKIADQVHYGQVVAVEGDKITIASAGHRSHVVADSVSAVAPVVALLLEHVHFNCNEWSTDDLASLEGSILNRLLGKEGNMGSKNIEVVLEEMLDESIHPSGDNECHWLDPKSGDEVNFVLQHAVDFAYHVDGGASPVLSSIGESFCRPPVPQRPHHSDNTDGSVAAADGLFDPFTDDDETPQDHSEQERGGQGRVHGQQDSTKRALEAVATPAEQIESRQKRLRTAVDHDALIMEKLSDDPDLMQHFLATRQRSEDRALATRESALVTAQPPQPMSTPAPAKKVASASKFDFAPREAQRYVHERVTSARHKGKSSTVFVKSLARSLHVKFKALPGVCTRAYDLRFGSSGLSIRHFARFQQADRIAWLEAGGSNFDNLSASAEFTAAPPATSIEEVADAARVFLTYAREYCCVELVQLVECIVEFIEETLAQVTWTSKDLSALVYWVNDVLEDFRSAAEANEDLTQVKQRCSSDDRMLRDLMFVKLHRQATNTVHAAAAAPYTRDRAGGNQETIIKREGKRRLGKIPLGVLQQLPVQVDPASGQSLSLCMRFLSNLGCEAEGDGGCPIGRGHFVPKKLHQLVKNEINRRFQGLKNEHKQL